MDGSGGPLAAGDQLRRDRHLEQIFGINKAVPVDLFPVFGRYYYNAIYVVYTIHKSQFIYQKLIKCICFR